MIKFITKENLQHGVVGDIYLLEPITTTERNSLTPEQGWIINNSTTARYEEYRGSEWQPFSPPEFILNSNDFLIEGNNIRTIKKDILIEDFKVIGSDVKAQPLGSNPYYVINTFELVSGRLYLIPIVLHSETVLNGVYYFVEAGTFTASNENRIGLYSTNGDGSALTLVASSANNANHFTNASGVEKRAFTSSYNASPGLYYVAVIHNRSAATVIPRIAGNVYNRLFSFHDFMFPSGRSWARHIASTTLSSSISLASTSRTNEQIYITLY